MFLEGILEDTNISGLSENYDVTPNLEYDEGDMGIIMNESQSSSYKLDVVCESVDYMIAKTALQNNTLNESVSSVLGSVKEHIKKFFKKIKEIILSMWKKIKGVFENLKLKVFALTSIEKFVALAEKQLKDLTDFKGAKCEMFEYSIDEYVLKTIDNIDTSSSQYIISCMKSSEEILSSIKGKSKEDIDKNSKDLHNKLKQVSEKAKNDKYSEFIATKVFSCTKDKINNNIYKGLRSNQTTKKTKTISNANDAIKFLKDYKDTVNALKLLTDATDKVYKASLAELDKIESKFSAKAEEGSKLASSIVSVVQDIAKLSKGRDDFANRVIGAAISALKEQKTQSITIVKKCISAGKSNKKKEPVNASTDLIDTIMSRI